MTTVPSSPNPVTYAEKVLDVHGPWTEAQERLQSHADASELANIARRSLRNAKQKLIDRKMEITSEAPSTVPNFTDYNTTQRREAIKILIAADDETEAIEHEIATCQSDLDSANAEIKHHELGLHALTARMTELGGLLHFFAEAKHAQTAQRSNPQVDTTIESESSA